MNKEREREFLKQKDSTMLLNLKSWMKCLTFIGLD